LTLSRSSKLSQEPVCAHNPQAGFYAACDPRFAYDLDRDNILTEVLLPGPERAGHLRFRLFDLHRNQGTIFFQEEEIDLALVYGSEVAQLKLSKPSIGPAVTGLPEGAADQVFQPWTFCGNLGPVEEVPLLFLAKGAPDSPREGTQTEHEEKSLQCLKPCLDGRVGDLEIPREGG
jgi:hypothetical protein